MNILAIVIPYYKISFFKETLESLANQTNKNFKVYIGDDASPDNPVELLREFEGKIDFTYKRFDENLGGKSLVKQWERCLEMVEKEEWFMILGDDDVLEENVVSQFHTYYTEFGNENNVVRYCTHVIDEDGNPISKMFLQPRYEKALDSYFRKLNGGNRSSLSEYIFRRAQYEKYGFKNYPVAWTTDDRAVIDFCEGKDIFSINEAKVLVRKSSVHISSDKRYSSEMQKAHILSLKDFILDYGSKMSNEQRAFLVQSFENQVLSFPILNILNIYYLILFFSKYMDSRANLLLIKSIVHRLLKF